MSVEITHTCDDCSRDTEVCLCSKHLEERLKEENEKGYEKAKQEFGIIKE